MYRFIDGYGYGLAQWTSESRKKSLLENAETVSEASLMVLINKVQVGSLNIRIRKNHEPYEKIHKKEMRGEQNEMLILENLEARVTLCEETAIDIIFSAD